MAAEEVCPNCGQQRGSWELPPPEECEETEYDTPAGEDGDILHFRQYWHLFGGTNLASFAIIAMSPLGGRLRRVAAADICHGELHVHIYDTQGRRIGRECMRPVSKQEDVDDGYGEAIDRIVEKWEHYKRRWRDG